MARFGERFASTRRSLLSIAIDDEARFDHRQDESSGEIRHVATLISQAVPLLQWDRCSRRSIASDERRNISVLRAPVHQVTQTTKSYPRHARLAVTAKPNADSAAARGMTRAPDHQGLPSAR